MKHLFSGFAVSIAALAVSGCAVGQHTPNQEAAAVQIQYLEIVTPNVDETIAILSGHHGVTFSDPQQGFGNARIADLANGGRIGVRGILGEHEAPIVRPYLLVDDIEAATQSAEAAGAEFAMRATEIPGQGKFAIYFLGGIQHGLWEK